MSRPEFPNVGTTEIWGLKKKKEKEKKQLQRQLAHHKMFHSPPDL